MEYEIQFSDSFMLLKTKSLKLISLKVSGKSGGTKVEHHGGTAFCELALQLILRITNMVWFITHNLNSLNALFIAVETEVCGFHAKITVESFTVTKGQQ